MKNYTNWIIAVLSIILLPLLCIAGFNFYIDPLWNFNHSNQYNSIQIAFDERQQKTGHLTFNREPYQTLIMGSSRVTYINQADFIGYNAYNYAVNNMLLSEYREYADYARRQNGQDFAYIVLGLDFFASNENVQDLNKFEPPGYYTDMAGEIGYRYKTLLSLDVLEYSRKNYDLARSHIMQNFTYDRNNIKRLNHISDEEKKVLIANNLVWYGNQVYNAEYKYGPVKETFQQLRKDHPDTKFIVFTTPISAPLFKLMMEKGLYPEYARWLTDSVEVFGEVYNFMDLNSITCNMENYYDASHFYPEIGTMIARRVTGVQAENLPADFGVLINKENLSEHLQSIMQETGATEIKPTDYDQLKNTLGKRD